MQIPPASLTHLASGAVGATANAQKSLSATPVSDANAPVFQDINELTGGNPDRDAQGQGDGLPGQRKSANSPEGQESSPLLPLDLPVNQVSDGGIDLCC